MFLYVLKFTVTKDSCTDVFHWLVYLMHLVKILIHFWKRQLQKINDMEGYNWLLLIWNEKNIFQKIEPRIRKRIPNSMK